MKAVAWHGRRDVRVDTVPDPTIQQPTDAIVRITSTAICGSDLHLYEVLGMFIDPGDILGHEPMGIVEAVGSEVTHIAPGDRVVIPFNISCGHCFMCGLELFAQCETTQNRDQGTGASLFGYTKLYGQVPGGQAELLRVPQAQFGPIKVPDGVPDERFLYFSDVLPTSWQAVKFAGVPEDARSVAVLGLGPIGLMSARIAQHLGARVIATDLVPDRLARARADGIEVVDVSAVDDVAATIREMTDGRGPEAVIDAVGLEAHGGAGATAGKLAQAAASYLPDKVAQKAIELGGVDRITALSQAIDIVRRGGIVSVSGVYGGTADPLNLQQMFDKGIVLRLGQAHVKRWIDDLMPIVTDPADPLGTESFATHRLPLEQAPHAYEIFQKKQDGAFKIVLQP
jgi:threonine dehydrogenase-like Zn-dependent dehydrogenase